MVTRDIFGLATSILVLAGISMMVYRASDTVQVVGTLGDTFNKLVRTATGQS